MRTSDLDGSGRDETIVCGRPGGRLITTPFWPAGRGPEVHLAPAESGRGSGRILAHTLGVQSQGWGNRD